jgi:hypothetical protein
MKTKETKSLIACLYPFLWNARGERKLHGVSHSLLYILRTDIALFAEGLLTLLEQVNNNPLGTKDRGWNFALSKKTGCSKDKSHSDWHKLFQSSIQINFGNFCNF